MVGYESQRYYLYPQIQIQLYLKPVNTPTVVQRPRHSYLNDKLISAMAGFESFTNIIYIYLYILHFSCSFRSSSFYEHYFCLWHSSNLNVSFVRFNHWHPSDADKKYFTQIKSSVVFPMTTRTTNYNLVMNPEDSKW